MLPRKLAVTTDIERQQLLDETKVFGEFTGCTPNEGLQCGCVPQAWLAILVSVLQIFLYAPLALFSNIYYDRWVGAKILLRMCWLGMEPWTANIALLFGMGNLHQTLRLQECSVPSKRLQGSHQRVRNSFMSDVLGSDFIMGEGDYDYWMPSWILWLGAQVLSRMALLYYPNTLEPEKLVRCDRVEFDEICETTIERFGAQFGARVDLSAERHSELGAIRLCVEGLGASALERRGSSYVVDYSSIEAMPVREGYMRMGGCMRLSSSLDHVEGLDLFGKTYLPTDPEWAGALHIFRCTCGAALIFYPHTISCHYLRGGFTATVVREMDPDHPWRRVLTPFTVMTLHVNWGAKSIISGPGAIFDRLGPFTQWSTQELFRSACRQFRVESLASNLQRRGVSDLGKEEYPYGYWGLKLYSIFETFAREYIDHYWPTDASVTADAGLRWFFDQYSRLLPEICEHAPSGRVSAREELVTFLASHIWEVTAVHEHTGHVGDLLRQYDMFHTHVVEGSLENVESLLPSLPSRLSLLFARALTSRPGAKLYQADPRELSRFFLDSCDPAISDRFMASLQKLHEEIAVFDAEQPDSLVFKSFDPYVLEISVTV
ncbi:Alox15b [Symbiodinium sp. CCMP2592]|nr:Alox15b [Symbiodinium sp. CCMP2592]